MSFWSRCLIALFLHIGCIAVDHRHRNSELPYEEDELRLILGQSFLTTKLLEDENELNERIESHDSGFLSFHPSSLDFKECPVGMPRLGVVRVDNRLTDENLKLISISGSTVHFHSSFFADKIISPGSNTTFEVVFLSRSEGLVESNLYIHTSKGLYKYHVEGVGLPNPYRLKPLVGARIPVNGSYEPVIEMHNPHGRRIQVVEMLSSGSDFHLSLPDAPDEEDDGLWAIEPFQTKPVMKGTFQGKAEGNHTGYIKIRVNSSLVGSEYLLLPVEVTVSSSPGIYSPQESLDFGLLVPTDKPKTLSLSLINAQEQPINVQSVAVKGEPNTAVKIEFRPISIEPDSTVSTVIALVTFYPSAVENAKKADGFLEIRSENGDSITVPFHAAVIQGELLYNKSSLGFYAHADTYPPRNFTVRNTFPTTVAIYEVSVSHPEVVEISSLSEFGSHVIPSGEVVDLFRLKVGKKAELCDPKAQIQLTLKSNLTNLVLPITCYDGKLETYALEGNELKFGSVELHSTHVEYFSLGNPNPVEIRLKSWGSNTSWAQVELVGMQEGRKEDLVRITDFDGLKKSLFLQPGHMAVFSVEVRRPSVEGVFWGESFVTTDHNQTLRFPFHVGVSKGAIYSDVVHFDKAFPGKISYAQLYLSSSYNQTTSIRRIWASPRGTLCFFPSSVQDLELPPHRKTCVGKIQFDPKEFCQEDCFAGFLLNSPMGENWIRASLINWETASLDWSIFKTLQNRYEEVKDATVSNMSLWVETNGGKEFKVASSVTYTWPRLITSRVVLFPLTAIGNETIIEIQVTNPTTSPLFVQALLANDYGRDWEQYVQGNGVGGNLTEGSRVFSLTGVASEVGQSLDKSEMFAEVQRSIVAEMLESPIGGVSFLLPPAAKFQLKCQFKPISKDLAATLLLLRNNLTGVEVTWLKGRAGTGRLTLGNGPPGSSLLFQITDKLLQACEKDSTSSKYLPPQLTVRRSFLARNVGDLPLEIRLVEIYPPQVYIWPGILSLKAGESCEGFGFRILNCTPFTLQPNETHSIDIAYTPDFTMSRTVRSLRLLDSNGLYYNYSLVAMVPSGMLDLCSSSISRPAWEYCLKWILISALLLAFCAGSFLAHSESTTIVAQAIVATIRVLPDGVKDVVSDGKEGTKLDLKAVYDNVDKRFKRSQQELVNQNTGKMNTGSQCPPAQTQINPSVNQNPPKASTPPPVQPNTANRSDPSQTTGVRNRKGKSQGNNNNNYNVHFKTTMTTANTSTSTTDLNNAEKSIGGKGQKAEREDEPGKRRVSLSDDPSNNNNINHAHESKKYVEVMGKKKGKSINGGKGKNTQAQHQFQISKLPSVPGKAAEEETSSTTTESSNADDVGTNLIGLEMDTRTRTECPPTAVVAPFPATEPKDERRTGAKQTMNENSGESKKGRKEKKKEDEESILGLSEESKKLNPAAELKRKVQSKKKQLSGSSSSGSLGSESPGFELSNPWEVPKYSGHDSYSDRVSPPVEPPKITALRRPPLPQWQDHSAFPPINASAQQTFSQAQYTPSAHFSSQQQFHTNYVQPQTPYRHYNYPQTTPQSTNRRPGVIGQTRQGGNSIQGAGYVNGVLSNVSHPLNTNTVASTQAPRTGHGHGTVSRTTSWSSGDQKPAGGVMNGIETWSNGCGDPFGSVYGTPPATSTPPPMTPQPTSSDPYSYKNMGTDLLSSLWQMQTFESIPPVTPQYSRNSQTLSTSTGTPQFPISSGGFQGNVTGQLALTTASTSFPLNLNASEFRPKMSQKEFQSTAMKTVKQGNGSKSNSGGIGVYKTPTGSGAFKTIATNTGVGSRGTFISLNRIRSDTGINTQQGKWSGPVTNWNERSTSPSIDFNPTSGNVSELSKSSTPPPIGTWSSNTTSQSDWKPLANSARDNGWSTETSQPSYWPTSTYLPASNPISYIEARVQTPPLPISRPTRPLSRSDSTNSPPNGIALQNQREIEVGLGFNPFGSSSIWTPHDSNQGSGWTPPRSTHR